MADLKVRSLDDYVVNVLRARARQRGVSLEEEARRTLAESVRSRRRGLLRRLAALREAAGPPPTDPSLDSVTIIRHERDAWG